MSLFGTSGIRAVFDRDLVSLAYGVGMVVGCGGGNVVVATDTRTSSDAMKHAVMSGLLASGAGCHDAGVAPTPTLAFIAREYDAGVMITASHNPPEYNGLKLLNPDGSSFDSVQQKQLEAALAEGPRDVAPWAGLKRSYVHVGAVRQHIEYLAPRFPRDLKLRVVVDAGCGAASEVTPRLLEKLGCEVITLNCYPSGFFPRGIEPTEANLEELRRMVRDNDADLGIAHDGDADRMMAVDERGEFIPGDKLLAIFAWAVGAKDVVTTLDASMAIDEMGFAVRRTPVGDTWVSEELRNGGGDFGGETSGSWVFPDISLCPDGIYAAARIAAIASQHRLSALAESLPSYPLLRGSVGSDGVLMSRLEARLMALEPLSVSNIDGVKLNFDDGWLLVRASGTEPKIRLTAEARSEARARQLYDDAVMAIKNSVRARGRKS